MVDAKTRAKYQVDIGVESHVQLKTNSKLFCACANDPKASEPNTNLCPVCLGMPGSLPVLNAGAVKLAVHTGLALNAKIAAETKFDRKNYFYPDLPKGYQISQYDQPITYDGVVELPDGKKVGIIRAHLEEDAGKSIHEADYSLVDLNRAGTPLMEVVSAPDIHSPAEAKAYAQELYNIMRYSEVSDVDLFRGNMRFDVNVSVRPKAAKRLGTRTETKNLNSFRSVEKAAEYEVNRQIELLEKGQTVTQETMGWDEAKGKTYVMRVKEGEDDYRYFPEPDLPPVEISKQLINQARQALPKQPKEIRSMLKQAGLDEQTTETLLANPEHIKQLLALKATGEQLRGVAKYYAGKVRAYQNEHPEAELKIGAADLLKVQDMQSSGQINSSAADSIIEEMITNGGDPAAIAKSKNLIQVSDESAVAKIVEAVIKSQASAVADYKGGNANSLQFLVGQVMKESRGQVNPELAAQLLKQKLA